jgi:hypothetical protein
MMKNSMVVLMGVAMLTMAGVCAAASPVTNAAHKLTSGARFVELMTACRSIAIRYTDIVLDCGSWEIGLRIDDKYLTLMATKMTAEKINEAEARAKKWQEDFKQSHPAKK